MPIYKFTILHYSNCEQSSNETQPLFCDKTKELSAYQS